ncbi:PREDICTED: uncharacterized protein LOC106320429 [Brassica oleracea var. oleracea]|uniref:uncharacterized protein LOC106320429 n=1 Tax=Brassica oleracea var. oleracea TaxID=109376 RepID=UPI0006A728B8|nr:PREDICTED: uncharacterized protein LOC106320429 [Brassica oleracea var. oleracea]
MMASTLSRLFSRSRPILLRRVSFRSCFPKHTLASSLGSVSEWMNINGYNGRGLVDLPRKHPLAAGAAKIPNDGSPYYNRQSLLHYQKLQQSTGPCSRPILLRRVSFRSCFPKHTLASSLGSVSEWMNINGYNGRGLVDLPRKHPLAAGLGRAVALQNFEKKLKSTRSNVPITKSEPAETRPLEQQEKTRMIHEKFKDDVGNHLEDFKSAIGGLEANHSELKGSIKKQRTSHQKLGIETNLNSGSRGCSVTLQQIMRMIHEKFEEDVGNHLEDFKSAIEGLEVGANQQKGIQVEKQLSGGVVAQLNLVSCQLLPPEER